MFYELTRARLARIAAFTAVSALVVGGASAKVTPPERAWGKAGVTYDEYRADALECGQQALAANIDNTLPVSNLRQASQELESLDTGVSMGAGNSLSASDAGLRQTAQAAQSARGPVQLPANRAGGPNGYSANGLSDGLQGMVMQREILIQNARLKERYAEIKKLMFQTARTCMEKSGYSRFTLTAEQQGEFKKIKDVEERRRFLHTLASDQQVLDTQKYAD